MSFALALIALATSPQQTAPDPVMASTADVAAEAAARRWLALLDQGRWADSYAATGRAFQTLNTAETWAAASERVRAPLGAALSRTLLGVEYLPAPPQGYQVVKYRTRFATKPNAVETVTLDQDAGIWRVVGVTVG